MPLRVDVHLHGSGDDHSDRRLLERILCEVLALRQQGRLIVAKVDELLTELSEANATTNEIADDLADLLSKLDGGLSAPEAEVVKAEIVVLKDKLKAVAATHTPTPPTL